MIKTQNTQEIITSNLKLHFLSEVLSEHGVEILTASG